jgi:hypothetical protein
MRHYEQERYDRAIEELRECRLKLERIHAENRHLRDQIVEQTDKALRDEVRRYRKALSYIGCAPNGSDYQRVARIALGLPATDEEAA